MEQQSEKPTFLITGVSSGLGRAISIAALGAGHTVVGTVRTQADADAFGALADGAASARVLDVTDDDAVFSAVDEIERTLGPIGVLVANAGYGLEGTIEETTMADARRQFDVNVFGAVASIKAVLPFMRERRAGHIITITSMGGLRTFPGVGFYHGSKYALEGITETLAREVEHLGIRVTAVEPGGFRTDWAGRSMVRAPSTIADYEEVFAPLRATRLANSGRQPGNPEKAGAAILELIALAKPPRHLLLGSDALRLVREGRAEVDADFAAWEDLTRSTDFPEGARL
jgi:NAD(P)-dependent dehydrogenase (short-subunit alcohol dehydrogenase family)